MQTLVTSVIAWLFMMAFGLYRLRRYRAGTLEREALARLRIAHAQETGDLAVLDEHHRAAPGPHPTQSPEER